MPTSISQNRFVEKITEAVARLCLDLSGMRIVTEAATGAYVVTPLLATLAGAQVTALTKNSRYGSVAQVHEETSTLASLLGVADRIRLVETLQDQDLATADVVTNSGHIRPINASMVARMKPGAAIPLMYEAWEMRSTDVDVDACRRRGILVAGTNERHPAVGVFDYLGLVVLKAALQASHDLIDERCLVISDNDFAPYVRRSLEAAGAQVVVATNALEGRAEDWDIVVVACTPPVSGGRKVDLTDVKADLYCQLFGDVDRRQVSGQWLPAEEPPPGHMGLTLQSLGWTPILKLQAGGLKCAEVMLREHAGLYDTLVQWVVGPHLNRRAGS